MRILIVDDSATSTVYLHSILQDAGYMELFTASSAEEALETLQSLATAGKPVDLVLMDISMPGMDGIKATSRIKSNPELCDPQVVMVTAADEQNILEKAFEAGATDYITKPVRRVELRARVSSALKLKREMNERKSREAELEALTRKLTELSNKDGLTGVANRRYFDEIFKKELLRAKRERCDLSLLMMDIDFFKDYNDSYGHLIGDTCLKKVAEAVVRTLNRPGDLAARFGGDEFVVLLPQTDARGAKVIAQDIQTAIRKLNLEHCSSHISPCITASIGVSSYYPKEQISAWELLAQADQALYEAKARGRNTIYIAAELNQSSDLFPLADCHL